MLQVDVIRKDDRSFWASVGQRLALVEGGDEFHTLVTGPDDRAWGANAPLALINTMASLVLSDADGSKLTIRIGLIGDLIAELEQNLTIVSESPGIGHTRKIVEQMKASPTSGTAFRIYYTSTRKLACAPM